MYVSKKAYSLILDDMDKPDPYRYMIAAHHEETAHKIAQYLDIPRDWNLIRDSEQLRGRSTKETRLIVDTWWLYKAPWSRKQDDIAEALMRWRANNPYTIRLINSKLMCKEPPHDILQASRVSERVAWQYEPSQDWTVQDSRSLFSGSQVHFSEDSRRDLQRYFTYDGKDVSRFVQRAKSHYLMEPRRRVSYEDNTSSETTVQSESPTASPRYWWGIDCGRRVRKKK